MKEFRQCGDERMQLGGISTLAGTVGVLNPDVAINKHNPVSSPEMVHFVYENKAQNTITVSVIPLGSLVPAGTNAVVTAGIDDVRFLQQIRHINKNIDVS